MSAIKNFFAHQREVKKRQDAYYARVEQEMNNPTPVVQDTSEFDKEVEHFDFLLKRNWFLDEDHVRELLEQAEEDVFQEIANRISTYDGNIQQAIFSYLPLPIGNVKVKVRDIGDEEMEIRRIKMYDDMKKSMDVAWEDYKQKNKLEPPVGYLDSELDDMYGELQLRKKELEEVKKKSLAGRYVPPGMRDITISDNPRVIAVTKEIEELENEIASQKKSIEQERDAWFANKRDEFEKQQMLSL